ncbi:XrtA system polysaccharide chain length determinant [Nitrosomonas sp. Nm132]|jgi:polysaccharide chain length determinant protein (PEP-CTERM system associated)|uniref:XrtA system polysaccharide chain length determinant n=1 Tax=Nitrosomonas sp. Nm132 TaxID=1881053 RepID=UPI0008823C0C|nr:XrtA system polysaccharide chain length determinant [Nitrosomonas sp. Nm132]SDH23533.1 polysaccharide chain length determinant protein, PEP-CTERM locus subfamily [Nitrosomonas sp. Nm132]
MDELIAQLLVYIKGTWKYRWVSIAVAWTIAILGWIVVYQLPDNYEASARIYVDTQNILRPLMAGMTVSPNPEQQVSIMSRTLISRPNVERITRMVDLDIKITDDAAYDKLVTALMKEITLAAAGRDNIFTISYSNKDPKLAKEIVQSLLTIFVEGGLEGKKQDSTSALRFIDQQIAAFEEKLITSENALTAFKQRNIGLLPGQGGDYYSQLTIALEDLEKAKLALKEAERARDAVRKQISGDETVLLLETDNVVSEKIINPEIDARIQALHLNLDNLRLSFTELHPDVVSTQRLIAQLEERKKEEAELMGAGGDHGRNYSPMLQQLNIALTEAEAVVASMEARVAEYTGRFERLKSMSTMVPAVEAELTQLNRDYNVNKANYEKLLERRASAEISGELTSATGLMSFRIIDPPTVPETPSGPDRRKLFSFVFIGSLLAGIGISFVVSQIRPTFHSQTDLRQVTGLAILGTVPMIWTDQEKLKRRNRLYAFGFFLLLLMVLYTALMVYVKFSFFSRM